MSVWRTERNFHDYIRIQLGFRQSRTAFGNEAHSLPLPQHHFQQTSCFLLLSVQRRSPLTVRTVLVGS